MNGFLLDASGKRKDLISIAQGVGVDHILGHFRYLYTHARKEAPHMSQKTLLPFIQLPSTYIVPMYSTSSARTPLHVCHQSPKSNPPYRTIHIQPRTWSLRSFRISSILCHAMQNRSIVQCQSYAQLPDRTERYHHALLFSRKMTRKSTGDKENNRSSM